MRVAFVKDLPHITEATRAQRFLLACFHEFVLTAQMLVVQNLDKYIGITAVENLVLRMPVGRSIMPFAFGRKHLKPRFNAAPQAQSR